MKQSSLEPDEHLIASARQALVNRAKDESWASLARDIGVPKSTLYHFAKRGYLPKSQAILARLIGKDVYRTGTIVVHVRRDGNGKFIRTQRGPDPR